MREKIYVSGKMTGDGNYRRKFLQAENRLFDAGYYPVNPAAFVPKYISWQGGADLRNDEYIIYDSSRCTIRYLIEIKN